MTTDIPVIAIDGLASSGKTAISRLLSKQLRFYFLDSGVLYRAFAFIAKEKSIDLLNHEIIYEITNNMKLLPSNDLKFNVSYNNIDITKNLYSEDIGSFASDISKHEKVRAALLPIQQKCARQPGLIANGRDMGTKVFINAQLKLYFIADLDIRAQRRLDQLSKSGSKLDIKEIKESLAMRDKKDQDRDISPLIAADDAVIIDSTYLNIESVLDKILELYKISRV